MRGSHAGPHRPGSRRGRGPRRIGVERLEERQLLTTFTVTNTGDLNPNGTVVPGSLRDAILKANANGGQDTIVFSISSGPQTILPGANTTDATLKPLPAITDSVIIDGTTQPGSNNVPIIELNGSQAGTGAGLVVAASNCTVKGLVINRFAGGGILIGSDSNTILDNYIGTAPDGLTPEGNGNAGIAIRNGSKNIIGGEGSSDGNVIAGNVAGGSGAGDGVQVVGIGSTNNRVLGNKIGTNLLGTLAVANAGAGIVLNGSTFTTIGGNQAGDGNTISGNGGDGIAMQATSGNSVVGNFIGTDPTGVSPIANGGAGISLVNATNVGIGGAGAGSGNVISGNKGNGLTLGNGSLATVLGNEIGVGADGTTNLGNGGAGISIDGAGGSTIGGVAGGQANVIADNGKGGSAAGVSVLAGTGIPIRGNSIFGNSRLGIDLLGDGPTANDNGDADTGPNNLQNFPVLTNVVTGAGRTLIQGKLNSTPNATFTLDFYANDNPDSTKFGQGQLYLPTPQPVTVTTDASGNASFSVTLSSPVLVGQSISATATDANGNTSEFALDQKAGQATLANLAVSVTSNPNPASLGSNFTYTITISNAGPDPATGVVLTDTLPDSVTFAGASVADPFGAAQVSQNGQLVTVTFADQNGNDLPIPAGQSATVTITVTPSMQGTVTNNVSVVSDQIDIDTSNNTAVTNTPVNIPADLSVVLTSDPSGQVAVGGQLVYIATVTNNGPGQATGVVLNDTLPNDGKGNTLVSFVSGSSGQGSVSPPVNGVVTANLGTLASGVSVAVRIVVNVGPDAGTLNNVVTVSADQTDPVPDNNTASAAVTASPSADLGVSLQTLVDGNPATAALAGKPMTYLLTITNSGPSAATGITVSAMLPGPDEITLSGTPTITAPAGSTGAITGANENLVTATLDQLASGQSATLAIVVIPSHPGQITATASVSGASTEIDTKPSNNTATATTPVSPADLAVSILTSPVPAIAGKPLTYDVIVTNLGPADATNVVVTDNLPAGASVKNVLSDQGTVAVNNGVVTASLGPLASGSSTTVRIIIVPQGGVDTVTNTAKVQSDQNDTNPTNNTATVTTQISPTDLAVSIAAGPNPVAVGDNLTYTITVVNKGPAPATGVSLKDTLPPGVTFVSASGGVGVAGVSGPTGGVVTAAIPELAAGGSATLTVVVSPTASGSLTTQASAIGNELDTDTTNNSASAQVTAFNTPGALQFSAPIYAINEDAGTATITVTRTGGNLGAVTVIAAALPGTAVPGADFVPVVTTLTVPDGQRSATFTVPVINNLASQPDLTVNLLLGFPGGGATLGPRSTSTLVVHNIHPDLFGPTVTNMAVFGGQTATNVLLTFSERLDPFRASNPSNYSIVASNVARPGGGRGDVAIPVVSAFYNPAIDAVAITPAVPLGPGTIYRVVVNGAGIGAVTDLAGNPLAGDGTGVNGRNFAGSFVQGTNITYGDANGDAVNLRLTGGGYLSLIRNTLGEAQTLRVVNPVPGRSALSGSVRPNRLGGDGITTIGLISGLDPFGRVRSYLRTPPFYVAKEVADVTASAVDRALSTGGLTDHVRPRRGHR